MSITTAIPSGRKADGSPIDRRCSYDTTDATYPPEDWGGNRTRLWFRVWEPRLRRFEGRVAVVRTDSIEVSA